MNRILGVLAALFATLISAHSVVVLPPPSNSPLPFHFTVPASDQSTVVQASIDLRNWTAIQTNPPSAAPFVVTDPQSVNFSKRFYRVLSAGAVLPDLSQATNSVFMPGEGFNAVQFAPNGKLGIIVWRGPDLIYRERIANTWSEEVIGSYGNIFSPGTREEYRFQPQAALLFDSQSRAHVLRLSGSSVAHHVQQSDGHFTQDPAISLASIGSSFSLFSAAIGPGDTLHLALVGSASSSAIRYGSNRNGSWQWSSITNVIGNPRGFLRQSYAPRWFSMAIDSQNNAHLTFCPQFVIAPTPEGYVRPYSELHYASNHGGAWSIQKIADVADGSGDAGAGASIAVGPNDQPAIANWHNDRWPSGSSLFCELHYYVRDAGGNWSKQVVAASASGYVAGDGDKGTGFAPYLRFDSGGRPNIAFCDDAAQHFETSGQNEYAGNLRHAYLENGSWIIRTVFAQMTALDAQIVYPAMALNGNEAVFAGLNRQTVWEQPDYRDATSTYQFFLTSLPLP
jgi:hypothetical protein